MTDETAQKEALQVAYTSAQRDYEDLERAVVAACREVEGEGGPSGSSVTSGLRSLGGRVAERLKGALCLGVQKTLSVVSTHYIIDLEQLATGYVVPDGDDDAKIDAMDQADAGAEGAASTWLGSLKATSSPVPRTMKMRASAMRREVVCR